MDYLCSKFGGFSYSCFGVIVRTDRITDRLTNAAKPLSRATVVSVSNYMVGLLAGLNLYKSD